MKKRDGMLNIGERLTRQNLKEKLSVDAEQKDSLREAWKNIMGEPCVRHTVDITCRNGVLFVTVDSQVWQQELLMHNQKELAARMAAAAGRTIVKIKIKAGR